MANRFKDWWQKLKRNNGPSQKPQLAKLSKSLDKLKAKRPHFKKLDLKKVNTDSKWIRWAVILLAIYLLAEMVTRAISLYVRPVFTRYPKKTAPVARQTTPTESFDEIEDRNIFNVEGTIPAPFESGLLDCMAQAKLSRQQISLLGTVVMNEDRYSVALLQISGETVAVRKDESFADGKFQAMKIERNRLCFQVAASQDLEYIEIRDDIGGLSRQAPTLTSRTTGITPVSESQFSVERSFLDKKLLNLNDILQTAKAVEYKDPKTKKMIGFFIQSIQEDSPFFELGIRRGDVLTNVNKIQLDNYGKGMQAFRQLRKANRIELEVLRGGQPKRFTYDIN